MAAAVESMQPGRWAGCCSGRRELEKDDDPPRREPVRVLYHRTRATTGKRRSRDRCGGVGVRNGPLALTMGLASMTRRGMRPCHDGPCLRSVGRGASCQTGGGVGVKSKKVVAVSSQGACTSKTASHEEKPGQRPGLARSVPTPLGPWSVTVGWAFICLAFKQRIFILFFLGRESCLQLEVPGRDIAVQGLADEEEEQGGGVYQHGG